MPSYWQSPIYLLTSKQGKRISIDVTSSVSAGLPPNRVILDELIPFLKSKKVKTILDFGAGALRHSIPLMSAGFQVCMVDFEEGYRRSMASSALKNARKHPNYSALIWPKDFLKDKRKFDCALLIYVLQVMPIPKERSSLLRNIYKKLNKPAYLFYASRFNQLTDEEKKYRVTDGYYKYPKRKLHSFYREFTTEETHALFKSRGFKSLRNLSKRGTDQMLVYAKGKTTWA